LLLNFQKDRRRSLRGATLLYSMRRTLPIFFFVRLRLTVKKLDQKVEAAFGSIDLTQAINGRGVLFSLTLPLIYKQNSICINMANLTLTQIRALVLHHKVGKIIAEAIPEVRDLYERVTDMGDIQGLFHSDGAESELEKAWSLERIADHYHIRSRFDVTHRIAITSVQFALKLLIPDEERRIMLRVLHHQAGALRKYLTHGSQLTPEDCRRGAESVYNNSTPEERKERAMNALRAQGKNPWSDEERERFLYLIQQPEYQWSTGRNKGLPKMAEISDVLNTEFHGSAQVRKPKMISTSYTYRMYRKPNRVSSTPNIPWSDEEKQRFLDLLKQPEYQWSTGRNKGRPKMAEIADILNTEYHDRAQVRKQIMLSKSYTYRMYRESHI